MSINEKTTVTVEATVDAPLEKAWNCWTNPEHVIHWNFAIPEWHCPSASNDLRDGGKFSYQMAARDGSFAFDFSGVHQSVVPMQQIESRLDDGRIMKVVFTAKGNQTHIAESFETETENPVEMQRQGWQMILDNYTRYVSSH